MFLSRLTHIDVAANRYVTNRFFYLFGNLLESYSTVELLLT